MSEGMRFHDIKGIGVDCVDISRFEDLKPHFLRKVYTKKEIRYCRSKPVQAQHFAGRFAGKESVIKAFDRAGKSVAMDKIEILNTTSGAPVVKILRDGFDHFRIFLSISHSREVAVAFCIVTCER
ncbi:MAG: holo-ACP synthase [Candidatus Aenigmarchaeota archaeon]|nr:holo-ACP synthase [Candidatus Aenigmarchaeota archaeon]